MYLLLQGMYTDYLSVCQSVSRRPNSLTTRRRGRLRRSRSTLRCLPAIISDDERYEARPGPARSGSPSKLDKTPKRLARAAAWRRLYCRPLGGCAVRRLTTSTRPAGRSAELLRRQTLTTIYSWTHIYGIRTFSPGHIPLQTFPAPTIPPPILHG